MLWCGESLWVIWLFHPTAKDLKSETEKCTATYGMRSDDCSSVSEMCYLLIVAWLCTPEAVLGWWLAVAWCTSMEKKLAGGEAHGDRILPRPEPSNWCGVWKPAPSHHGEFPHLLVHSWARGSLALQPMHVCYLLHPIYESHKHPCWWDASARLDKAFISVG